MSKINTDFLLDRPTVEAYQHAFRQGYDHKYPNENIIRLESAFLRRAKGKCLDYGYGFGENLLHFSKLGYEMYGIDIDESLKERVSRKIEERGLLLDYAPDLVTLEAKDQSLPYPDNYFDSILSNQVIYLLADETKVLNLIKEFRRVLKAEGRILISLMSNQNVCAKKGAYLGNNVYEYDDSSVMNKIEGGFAHRYYVVNSEPHIRWLFGQFTTNEIGYFDNSYFNIDGHHYVYMGSK